MDGEELNKRRKMLLAISIVVIVALSGFIVLFTVLQPEGPLVTHEPIIIWKDEDFNYYDFPGEGSKDNPFVIQNYNITTESRYGIYISNTTAHVIIRNCYIDALNDGIRIEYVADETFSIVNNKCVNNYVGINIVYSHSILIINNTCENNLQSGITLAISDHNSIVNNTCSYNGEDGIGIWDSINSTLINNICNGNGESGLDITYTANITLTNNYCSSNKYGVYLTLSQTPLFFNNTITENLEGIIIKKAYNGIFWMNLILENELYGIALVEWVYGGSENNMFHHNSFIDNNLGGSSQAYSGYEINYFYDIDLLEGNYWNDWISGNYTIDGISQFVDPYPLSESPHGIDALNI